MHDGLLAAAARLVAQLEVRRDDLAAVTDAKARGGRAGSLGGRVDALACGEDVG